MGGWLIALDKCPGVHLIDVGEALQHILCKVVALASVVWFGYALDCKQVWRKRFMLFVNYLICTAIIVEGFCLLMQEMLLNQLTV